MTALVADPPSEYDVLALVIEYIQKERDFCQRRTALNKATEFAAVVAEQRREIAERDLWLDSLRAIHAGGDRLKTLAEVAKLKEQFRMGAPYTAECLADGFKDITALYADDGELIARFDSESHTEAIAEFLNFIAKEPGR